MQTTLPELLQAVVAEENTGTLHIRQIPVPRLGPGQVLIRMAAAPTHLTLASQKARTACRKLAGLCQVTKGVGS